MSSFANTHDFNNKNTLKALLDYQYVFQSWLIIDEFLYRINSVKWICGGAHGT
jgi:hypothetical protein